MISPDVIAPEVIGPVDRVPNDAAVAYRLVEDAVFAYMDVVVAFSPVKFCSVDDAVVNSPPFRNARPDTVIAVDEAYGSTDAVDDVAVKLDANTLPATVTDDEANS